MFDEVRSDGLEREGLSTFARDDTADVPHRHPALASGRIDATTRRSAGVEAFIAWLGDVDDEPQAAAG